MEQLVVAIVLVGLAGAAAGGCASSGQEAEVATGDGLLAKAYEDRAADLPVEGQGMVARMLADDDEGSRHQRFIVRLDSGQSLLGAHNIDVAPRVDDLGVGDNVAFKGVYEWSEQGGTIHWTHHDPDGEHAAGWLRHGAKMYQ
jgi:hypothetical protein